MLDGHHEITLIRSPVQSIDLLDSFNIIYGRVAGDTPGGMRRNASITLDTVHTGPAPYETLDLLERQHLPYPTCRKLITAGL